MAHVVLEVTRNLMKGIEPVRLLRDLSSAVDGIAGLRGLDLKSRLLLLDHFVVGEDMTGTAGFVAVEVQIFRGKDSSEITQLERAVLGVLERAFRPDETDDWVDISVRVTELDRDNYDRVRSRSWPPITV